MCELDKRKHVSPAIRRLDLMMARNLDAHLKDAGLAEMPMEHGWCMRYLYENQEKEIFQKDIEKQFGMCRSSVTNSIQIMEKKGYLKREAVAQDARLKKVMLTEKGIHAHQTTVSIVDQINEQTVEGITDEELEIFFCVIDKLEKNLIRQKDDRQQGKE